MKKRLHITIEGERQDVTPVIRHILSAYPDAIIDSAFGERVVDSPGVVDMGVTVYMTLDGFRYEADVKPSDDVKPSLHESGLPATQDELPY